MKFKATTKINNKNDGVWQNITDSFSDNIFPSKDIIEASIDASNHVIKNVAIMGRKGSKNGHTYTDQAMNTLTRLSHGAKFFINHPSKSEMKDRDGVRDIRYWAGVFINPKREGDKVLADLKVRESYWDLVYDVATLQPAGMGNSINSRVKVFQDLKTGEESVLDIDTLKSVDLVANAATTDSLFESINDSDNKIKEDLDDYKKKGFLKNFDYEVLTEGLLSDKLKERKIMELSSESNNIIYDILNDREKNIASKKSDIITILDDLEKEIGNILSGKTEAINDNIKNSKEKNNMELKDITLEMLVTERQDLISKIKDTLEDASNIENMENELAELKTKLDELTTNHDQLKGANDSLTTENADLKKANEELQNKVDEFETKAKSEAKRSMIDEKIEAAKLAKEAVSDVFINDLMTKDEDAIEASISDRKELWSKTTSKVKGNGEEFNANYTNDTTKEKLESVKSNFTKNMKK